MVSKTSKMGGRSAVVVGGGIGGLAAAVALRQVDWRVTVLERAARFGEIGAGITLMSNGLRCLDAIGLGEAVRGSGLPMLALGMRTSAGRWLSRIDADGAGMQARMGTTAVVIHRAELHTILRDALPAASLLAGVATTAIIGGADGGPAQVHFRHQDHDAVLHADLVVGADGVHSWIRAQRWPDAPAAVYSGSTTWRAITTPSPAAVTEMSLSWGQGTEFGVMPIADGRTYWYAAANADEAQRNLDELRELRRRFGTWHEPIPALLAATRPQDVLRHDVAELAAPLPSFHRGRVVLLGDAAHPMTPNLGQGACQALEDAAVISRLAAGIGPDAVTGMLARYTAARVPRTTDVVRWSRRAATMTTWASPPAVALRNTVAWLTGRIAPGAALRGLAAIYGWQPPAAGRLGDAG